MNVAAASDVLSTWTGTAGVAESAIRASYSLTLGGAIHVHPGGRFAYVSNRADGTVEHRGEQVFNGGENSIAVFALDPQSGEPRRIQNAPTQGIHARTGPTCL